MKDPLFWRQVRTIARFRVLLALVTVLVVYVDPNLPPGGHWLRIAVADLSLLLLVGYAAWVWRLAAGPAPPAYLPLLTTWLDVLFSATLIGSTGAHQSPFYLWIVFTIVGAALKNGWQTAVRVSLAELILYLYVALYLPDLGSTEFVLLGFLARTLLLFALALVLAHMGRRLLDQNRMLTGLHRAAAHISAGRSTGEILGRVADSLTDLLEVEQVLVAAGEGRPVLVNMPRAQGEALVGLARAATAAAPPGEPWTLLATPASLLREATPPPVGAPPPLADARPALAGVRNLLITRFPGTGDGSDGEAGLLVACNRQRPGRGGAAEGFNTADQEVAELLAAQAGPLLETARLQEQRRSHAGADERRRIAAELHDGLIQTLASIDLRLLTGRELWRGREWETLGKELAALKQLAEEALAEARGAVNELAPVRLREQGLAAHLESMLGPFQERAGVPITAAIDLAESGAVPIPEPAALLLIGLLREGLNNIRKHARARQATLAITAAGGQIAFRLADDGAGFDPVALTGPALPVRHYGLAYLRERLAAADGELRVTSRPGEGTVLEARLPLLTEERLAARLSQAER